MSSVMNSSIGQNHSQSMQDYQQQANGRVNQDYNLKQEPPTVFASFHSELAGGNKVLRAHIERIEDFLHRLIGPEPMAGSVGAATSAPGDLASNFRQAIGEKTDLTERLGAAVKRLESLA